MDIHFNYISRFLSTFNRFLFKEISLYYHNHYFYRNFSVAVLHYCKFSGDYKIGLLKIFFKDAGEATLIKNLDVVRIPRELYF